MRFGQRRLQGDASPKRLDRCPEIIEVLVGQSEVVPGLGVLRREAQQLFIPRDRRAIVGLLHQRQPEIVERRQVLWGELAGLLELGDRRVGLALLQ